MMNPLNTPHIFQHHMPKGHPECTIDLGQINHWEKVDHVLIQRLISAYKLALKIQNHPSDDMWREVSRRHYQDLHQLILSENVEAVGKILQRAIHHQVCFGLGSGPSWYQKIQMPEHSSEIVATILDRLISFAEFLGVMDMENPEDQLHFGQNIYTSPYTLIESIEKELNIDIRTPRLMGLFGLTIKDKLITVRTPDCLYTSSFLHKISTKENITRIHEIGGGFGLCAYYFTLLSPRSDYAIYDLPMVNFIQGYYLSSALGAEKVCLYGENKNEKHRVTITPSNLFFEADLQKSLVFSQDVFPELDPQLIDRYLEKIHKAKPKLFFTINHDKKYVIPDYNQDDSRNYFKEKLQSLMGDRRVSKTRYWIRKGYIEELFSL